MAERDEATTHADLYQRHEQDSSNWEKADAVTGRPNDTPLRGEDKPALPNSTLASRAKDRKQAKPAAEKQVDSDDAEDKAVTSAATKAKRATKK